MGRSGGAQGPEPRPAAAGHDHDVHRAILGLRAEPRRTPRGDRAQFACRTPGCMRNSHDPKPETALTRSLRVRTIRATAGRGRWPAAMESRVGRLTTSATPRYARTQAHHEHAAGRRGPGDHRRGAPGPCGVARRHRRPGRPDHRRDQALRRRRRRRQHGPRRRPRGVLLVPRPIGLRQDDDPADDRGLRAADGGRDLPRRRARRGRAALPPPREHRVPALRAVPAHERRAERRLRAAPEGHQQARRAAPRRGGARARAARAAMARAGRGSCRAASSSASPSRGRSSTTRPCSSSTSRSAPST